MARPPRLANCSYQGHLQLFLTFCTHQRQPVLGERETASMVGEQLLRSSQSYDVAVDAYVFMPDHVHMLAKGLKQEADLTAFLSDLKGETGWQFRRDRKRRLWQEGFRDRVLRDGAEALSFLSYIVMNPVRAGLVASAAEYEFWGSLTTSREEILKRLGLLDGGG